VVAAEAAVLRSSGHEVVQHVVDNPSRPLETASTLMRAPWNRETQRTLERLARKVRPDVAHLHNTWFALSPSAVDGLRSARVPVVATVHNYRLFCIDSTLFREGAPCFKCVGASPAPGVRHRCYRNSLALSSVAAVTIAVNRRRRTWEDGVELFLAPSAFARGLLVQGGIPEERIQVKPHFVADPGPRASPPSASHTVLYVGRLAPGKGVDVLLEAWSRRGPSSLSLSIVGDGPLRAELEQAAPSGVRFLGRLPPVEVIAAMKTARALVFPSAWPEPFGMVLVEAMAAGLPVVGSDVGASREVLRPDPSAILVAPGADELARAVATLADGEVADRAGARARRRYEQHYTPERNLGLLEACYASVTAGTER